MSTRPNPTPPPSSPRSPRRSDLSKRARGQWGEDRAAAHYAALGYQILDRNWRCPIGELDLVVGRGDLIVFSEVKTRRDDSYGPAAAAVTPTKQRRIRRLAIEWLRAHDAHGRLRFDVVAITGADLVLIEHAF